MRTPSLLHLSPTSRHSTSPCHPRVPGWAPHDIQQLLASCCCLVAKLRLFYKPVDCSPLVLGISRQEWVAVSFSRASFRLRVWTHVFCIAGGFFTVWAARDRVLQIQVCFLEVSEFFFFFFFNIFNPQLVASVDAKPTYMMGWLNPTVRLFHISHPSIDGLLCSVASLDIYVDTNFFAITDSPAVNTPIHMLWFMSISEGDASGIGILKSENMYTVRGLYWGWIWHFLYTPILTLFGFYVCLV